MTTYHRSGFILLIAAIAATCMLMIDIRIAEFPVQSSGTDYDYHKEGLQHRHYSRKLEGIVTAERESEAEVDRLAALTEKLTTPRKFAMDLDDTNKVSVHQFLHLHHMKTGGTSMDYYLECARYRMKRDKGYMISYGTIHECDKDYYDRCKSGLDRNCLNHVAEAAMLSYCAPLKDLPSFMWGTLKNGVNVTSPPSHGAITVLRHPVDRVWSMFRFQTKDCFQCMPLTELYHKMDTGNMTDMDPVCYQQLHNHQVTNLLSSEWPKEDDTPAYQDEMLAEAIQNMKSFFTVVGLTEHLDTTIEIAGRVFPWMKPKVEWSTTECSISHANSSPRNNGCGPGHTNWDLPNHPDDETRAAIEAHNQLDLKLYAAAVQHFELQKRAVAIDEKQI